MNKLLYSMQGANFRDLKGIIIKEDGLTVDVVREPRELLKSGKPLVCVILISSGKPFVCYFYRFFGVAWNHFLLLMDGIWIVLCRCQTML